MDDHTTPAHTTSRRGFLRSAAVLTGSAAAIAALPTRSAAAEEAGSGLTLDAEAGAPERTVPRTGTQVVLVGTGGGPVPFVGRAGICTAVVVDGYTYLIDLGHGTFDQLGKTDLDIARIPAAFVTHLHSDHVADAWSIPWLRFGGANPLMMTMHVYGPGRAGGLPPQRGDAPVRVVNPDNPTPGTEDFFEHMIAGSAYDLNVRMRDETWPDIADRIAAHDVDVPAAVGSGPDNVVPDMEPFEVMRDERVRVSATLVNHAPVYPSYGFRIDTADGSVVISGDTARSENLIRMAEGADVLVHEVIDVRALSLDETMTPERLAHLTEAHTDVTVVGKIAEDAGVGRLVLSHLAPSSKALPDAGWKAQAQQGFSGPVHVGNDLDVIPV